MMLVPVGFLILIILAAITVDFSVAFLGAREVSDEANAIANNVAAKAVDVEAFRKDGTVTIDCARAADLAQSELTAQRPAWLGDPEAPAVSCDGDRVTVTVKGTVQYIFSKALPGAPHSVNVEGSGSATASRGALAAAG